jgi:23S rRNA pseudouridine2457 synthase
LRKGHAGRQKKEKKQKFFHRYIYLEVNTKDITKSHYQLSGDNRFILQTMHRYFILNKPADMVSQFVSSDKVRLLGDLPFRFPGGTHAIGRLDKDSEGLLLLTTDKAVTRLVFLGEKPHKRTYLIMVQNELSEETFEQLKKGVIIKITNGEEYMARPENLVRVTDPAALYPWAPDRREKYPHTWLLITLTEGKYRQVRKMALAVRHRCLRLIRLQMEDITLEGIAPGEVKELDKETFYQLAGISEKNQR